VKEYDNNNRGVLFKNDKGDNDKRPDYRGSATIDGVDLNISAWIKRSQKTGDAYMSLSFEAKKAAPPKATRAPVMDESDPNDDIPF
jgi:uncharacterized protein (DUF736 family)